MLKAKLNKKQCVALILAGIITMASPVHAEKPSWAGGGGKKAGQHEKDKKPGKKGDFSRYDDGHFFFRENQVDVVRGYFSEQSRSGHCPPGLAKKKNGCMPPGQMKKWSVGRPLPKDVMYYDLPAEVVVKLGPPPQRHRYVRVAGDILLIAVGTGMVVDAIQDLGNL